MSRVEKLRTKYPVFIYENFEWQLKDKDLAIKFYFKIVPDIVFIPEIKIRNVNKTRIRIIGGEVIDNLIFNLGMIELFSYWKSTCSPKIIIEARSLNSEQINWWKKVLFKGMAQFFYENKVKINKNFVTIIAKRGKISNPFLGSLNPKNYLVALGGGKDSLVTLEFLRKRPFNIYPFVLNPGTILRRILKKVRIKKAILAQRTIDPKLLNLNKNGFLNGHTPFSAYLAFLATLIGVIFDIKYLVFSNEKSAEEPNVIYQGTKINHQWSKTMEFEKMFRQYSKNYLARDIEYFSLIRDLSELELAKLFAKMPKYHSVFVSCNQPYKVKRREKRWCCKCAKCLSTYILLSPFLNPKTLKSIFGQDLLEKRTLKKLLHKLVYEKGIKPFECVGTFQELRIALYLTLKKYEHKNKTLPPLLTYFKKYIVPKYPILTKNKNYSILGPA